MYRWAECPGSIRLTRGIKSVSSEFAAEGTVAHDIGAKVLAGAHLAGYLGQKMTADGHDFIVSEEMLEAVEVYVNHVKAVIRDANDDEGVLNVIDYKHGAGIAVDVKGNPQLRYYALGALMSKRDGSLLQIEHKFDLTAVYPGLYGTADAMVQPIGPTRKVRMWIVQPRCPHPDGPIRSETIDAIDLMDFATELIDFAKATEDPNAPLKPGDHCRFCSAAGVCPALHARAVETAKQVFAPALPYDPAKLADTLKWLPVLEAWAKNVRQYCYDEAEAGRSIPGWKLVSKRPTRKWRDAVVAELALKKLGLGEPEMYGEPELQSPAAIEKVLTARKIKPADRLAALDPLVEKVSSGHTLAEESDPRPAVKQNAADVFTPV